MTPQAVTAHAPRATIVVCDDEESVRWTVSRHLSDRGYRCIAVKSGAEALDAVRDHAPSLMLLDLKMPGMDGLTVLRRLRESGSDVPVIIVSAQEGVHGAISATRLGALDYVTKPFVLDDVEKAVERALAGHVPVKMALRDGYGAFIGRSPRLQPLLEALHNLERVDPATVLLTGESGTGKDVLAREIHARGPRRGRTFLAIDCGALTESLIESELFGHERGAFTDARVAKPGLFEEARDGVVFLDEIGELTHATQSKLLRALENRTFKRVGGVTPLRLDASVIAATNKDLRAEVAAGRFREDLFFRLNVVPLNIPPLREHAEDIPLLVTHFLGSLARRYGRPILPVSDDAMAALQANPWRGNVRELRNVVERLVLLGPDDRVEVEDLPEDIRAHGDDVIVGSATGCPFVLPEGGVDLESVERHLIAQAMQRTGGRRTAAARLLGISRYALRYRLEKFGLDAQDAQDLVDTIG